jgi:hypothetical protein
VPPAAAGTAARHQAAKSVNVGPGERSKAAHAA